MAPYHAATFSGKFGIFQECQGDFYLVYGVAKAIGKLRYSKTAHTRFYHRFYVVWATKYRYKFLQGQMRDRFREIIMWTCSEQGVHIVKGVLSREHVHIFLSIPPKLSLSDVMQRIKGR